MAAITRSYRDDRSCPLIPQTVGSEEIGDPTHDAAAGRVTSWPSASERLVVGGTDMLTIHPGRKEGVPAVGRAERRRGTQPPSAELAAPLE
ncbi:unnamed protein product [Cutaneotrichosporon oleaginosum]